MMSIALSVESMAGRGNGENVLEKLEDTFTKAVRDPLIN